MTQYTEAMDVYSVLMQEAKARLLAMDTALEGKTGLPEVAVREYRFLQLRMLCELISLGCLTAQGNLQTGKLKDEYRADKIISRLQRLHADFDPYAATRTEAGIELRKDGFTKEELVKLYWKCGDVLHRGTVETLWSRSCSTARFSTLCARPRSSSRAGDATTTRSGPTAQSDTSHQHQRCSCPHSPRGRLRSADRLRRPRWRNGQP